MSPSTSRSEDMPRTRKGLRLVSWDRPQMLQVALVADQHDDDVRVRMIAQLLQPPRDVDVGLVLRDVIDKERTDRTTVVRGGDGTIPFLTSCSKRQRVSVLFGAGARSGGGGRLVPAAAPRRHSGGEGGLTSVPDLCLQCLAVNSD